MRYTATVRDGATVIETIHAADRDTVTRLANGLITAGLATNATITGPRR